MRATNLSFGTADIPFRASFDHASASRRRAETIIVHVEDAEGNVGIGEGCPREYVTGETMETALAFLHRRRHMLAALADPQDLANWIVRNTPEIDENPSAFCAAELALIDLYSKQLGQTIEQLFVAPVLSAPLTVSAVYGTGSFLKFRAQAMAFQRNGMTEAKLKVSGKTAADAKRAAFLAQRGKVRLDANNLWPNADAAVSALKHLSKHAWAIEEPLAKGDWAGMKDVHERTGMTIIADESFLTQDDLKLMPPGDGFIPNFRVSKMGGLMRSVSALRMALDQGRKIIVGAQVGETSILARAGLLLAGGAADRLVGYEGGYGTHLLRQDIVEPPLAFGEGGKLKPPAGLLERPGLGLQLRADAKSVMRAAETNDYWMPLAHSAQA
jgi:L-alanine-DL-glutamate epimerase-like enolase superfamily enzyme